MTDKTYGVIAALDLEEGTEAIVAQAVKNSLSHGGRVLLLHASEQIRTGDEEILQGLASRHQSDQVQVHWACKEGKPTEQILQLARESEAQLLVFGTHGNNPIFDALSYSVGQELLQSAEIPMLLVPTNKQ